MLWYIDLLCDRQFDGMCVCVCSLIPPATWSLSICQTPSHWRVYQLFVHGIFFNTHTQPRAAAEQNAAKWMFFLHFVDTHYQGDGVT